MGLFDMFKTDDGAEMTPHFVFATSLLYMMSADGEIDNEEVGHLLSVLGGEKKQGTIGVGAQNQALLDKAVKYRRQHSLEQFLAEATPLLTDSQRMCILMNLLDSLMADGIAEQQEQTMFDQFKQAFGIADERFRPFFEVIVTKNDRSVFTDQNHPKNQPGYQVKLSGL